MFSDSKSPILYLTGRSENLSGAAEGRRAGTGSPDRSISASAGKGWKTGYQGQTLYFAPIADGWAWAPISTASVGPPALLFARDFPRRSPMFKRTLSFLT